MRRDEGARTQLDEVVYDDFIARFEAIKDDPILADPAARYHRPDRRFILFVDHIYRVARISYLHCSLWHKIDPILHTRHHPRPHELPGKQAAIAILEFCAQLLGTEQ